jgi:shikimate 5-dehydrogenase
MKKGIAKGVRTMNGLSMLFFQALKAFELWTGVILNKEQIDQGLKQLENYVYMKRD